MLLLEPAGQSDLFRIIAPEGRYRLAQGDIVTPIVDNAVTRDLRGRPLQYLEQLLGMPSVARRSATVQSGPGAIAPGPRAALRD